ncbi:MAG TPA: SLC13 family permease [Acidimicrobiales bacterium]|jgi:arsenical pump membrane protein|nr:SLC13 family permease [Acidimicrobiales bacterium]
MTLAVTAGSALGGALDQSWPPFVLVAGLLLIGVVAASDGFFEAIGSRLARLPGGAAALFVSLMALVACVTVVLNLDTSVVFLTPILLHAARRRDIPETAWLYGAVFMSNSASLLLPGSNLTNLLVLSPYRVSGGAFLAHSWGPWLAGVVVTIAVVGAWRSGDLRSRPGAAGEIAPLRPGLGLAGIAAAAALVVGLRNPALPVVAVGLVAVTLQVLVVRRLVLKEILKAVSPAPIAALFVLATVLGTLARLWSAPGHLMAAADAWATAAIGAGSAALVNNLPSAVLLSSRPPAHPLALLIGLDLGPNLVVTGALSAVLWLRVARSEQARPSAVVYSKVGAVLVPLSMAAAMLAGGGHGL